MFDLKKTEIKKIIKEVKTIKNHARFCFSSIWYTA
jgi:hypothetical protein